MHAHVPEKEIRDCSPSDSIYTFCFCVAGLAVSEDIYWKTYQRKSVVINNTWTLSPSYFLCVTYSTSVHVHTSCIFLWISSSPLCSEGWKLFQKYCCLMQSNINNLFSLHHETKASRMDRFIEVGSLNKTYQSIEWPTLQRRHHAA